MMSLKLIEGIWTISLDFISTAALAAVFYLFGEAIKKHVTFFTKYCMPAAVIGGFLFAVIVTACKGTGVLNVRLDTTLQLPFQLAFFTVVGLGGSLGLLKKGGKSLILYMLVAWFICAGQSEIGVRLSQLMDINPLIGIMASNVSLQGGPANAAAWGPIAEGMGATGATAVGLATAALGMIIGGMTGGPLASWLIDRNKLKIETAGVDMTDQVVHEVEQVNLTSITTIITLLLICMAVGSWLAGTLSGVLGYALPGYIGSMVLAMIFRNINDKKEIVKINYMTAETISDFSLNMFVTMAMMSIKFWELYALAGPLVVIVVVESLFMFFVAGVVLFRLAGKDYDAANLAAGLIGHGLGNTANAVANMDAVSQKYGLRSEKAFLIVPMVGAVLIDIAAQPLIIIYLNMWK